MNDQSSSTLVDQYPPLKRRSETSKRRDKGSYPADIASMAAFRKRPARDLVGQSILFSSRMCLANGRKIFSVHGWNVRFDFVSFYVLLHVVPCFADRIWAPNRVNSFQRRRNRLPAATEIRSTCWNHGNQVIARYATCISSLKHNEGGMHLNAWLSTGVGLSENIIALWELSTRHIQS